MCSAITVAFRAFEYVFGRLLTAPTTDPQCLRIGNIVSTGCIARKTDIHPCVFAGSQHTDSAAPTQRAPYERVAIDEPATTTTCSRRFIDGETVWSLNVLNIPYVTIPTIDSATTLGDVDRGHPGWPRIATRLSLPLGVVEEVVEAGRVGLDTFQRTSDSSVPP